MARKTSQQDQTIITYEEQRGQMWIPQRIALRENTNVGAVLREMRSQPVIRSVQLTKA
jgi:hypothetical protein